MSKWVSLLAWMAASATAAPLHLVTEAIPPSVQQKGDQIGGYTTDKVRAIMQRSGTAYTMDLFPWSRTFTLAQTQPATCAFPMARIPEREQLFKWVGPLHNSDWVLIGRSSDHWQIHSLDDVRGRRIGSYVGDNRGQYLKEQGLNLELVDRDELNIRKLQLGRIDLWVGSRRYAEIEIERRGLTTQLGVVYTFRQVSVYLACNREVADTDIARWNVAVQALTADGSFDAIEARYLQYRD